AAPGFAFGAPWFFNAGESRIQGFEIETDTKLTSALTLNAAVGFLDAKYTKLGDVAVAGGLTTSDKLLNVPKWSASAGGTYSWALPLDRALKLHADYVYKSEMARDTANTPLLMNPGFGLLNAMLSIGPTDGRWQLMLDGANLT